MSQPVISKLNYNAVLSTEDWTTQQQNLENEIVTRFKLTSGFPTHSTQFGIVDVANPSAITASETSRPLFVGVSSLNSLSVSVNSGYAISPNGSILNVPSALQLVNLATNPLAGNIYVILLEASVNTSGGTTTLNDYQILQSSQEIVYGQVTSIPYVSGWSPSSTQVVLAVVTVLSTNSVLSLNIDQTQNTHSWNRPWYSPVDTQHRSYLGSGSATVTNPHGTSFNDLTVPGTVGMFQGLSGQGSIVSQSRLRNKMPGALVCNDSISVSSILFDDGSGSKTKKSIYSKANAKYVYLSKFPLRLGSVYDSATPANAIAAEIIPGTNILVFGPWEDFSSTTSIVVEYTACAALLPPAPPAGISNYLTFQQPQQGEAIVSGGFIYPTIADPTLSMEGAGPFARRYYAYFLATGILESFPQVLMPAQSALTAIQGSFTPIAPSRISVGLTNTTGSPNLSVTVTVYGTTFSEIDSTSTTGASETLTFTPAGGFQDQIVPSTVYDLAGQILVTQNKFSLISSVSVSVSNAGSNPQIQMWAEVEPGTTPELNDSVPVCVMEWDGTAVRSIEDYRRIQTGWVPSGSLSLQTSAEVELDSIRFLNSIKPSVVNLVNSSVRLMTEDFNDLKYFDSARGFVAPTQAIAALGFNNTNSLVAGDTIQLTPQTTLIAIDGTPSVPGQFDVSSGVVSVIIGNLINAINDTAFTGQVTAALSSTNPLVVNLTLNTPTGNTANSIQIIATTINPTAVTISQNFSGYGFNYAADGFGECYLDRNLLGVLSPNIPDDSNLNPYPYSYRRRYRSRAISLPYLIGDQSNFLIEVHGENKAFPGSIRVRGSYYANSKIWNSWQVISAVTPGQLGLYQVTFLQSVHKLQVEYYGNAAGISIYAARP